MFAAVLIVSSLTALLFIGSLFMKSIGDYVCVIGITLVVGFALQLATFPFLIFSHYEAMILVYCFGGALICMVYIVIDLYIIMKDAKIDEYILASIMLYVDIIRLFIFILRIVGSKK